eukprot:CAMPEP_0113654272 /NCGR_PEP_ID=MMETSP0017_2-20120614/29067_1 /TAXON_ID=2856 /ORGANISM="Cylindrotheca closterium" /LENGTH=250 /DNA_ID=CAMNT_0000567407 /DNA_START=63 /DNA_END=812 /DNA_ORIENTATION=+ /assembly_acc=CAM_ASM_000147
MTVKYRGEPQDASFVQEYVKSVIKEQMETDPSKLYVQDVTSLGYVGERINFAKPSDTTRIEAKQTWGVATMTTIVSLSTLMCLGIAILMMRRKKKETNNKSLPRVKIEFDLEECSTDSLPKERGSGSGGDSDDDDYDVPLTLMASTEEMELPPEHAAADDHWNSSLDPRLQDLPPPPIQLQLPTIGRPLKVQRQKKRRGSFHSRSSSFSTLLPISETNSEHDDDDDDGNEFDQNSDINLSFGDEIMNTPV